MDPVKPPVRLWGVGDIDAVHDDGDSVHSGNRGLVQLHQWTPTQRSRGDHRSMRAVVDRHQAADGPSKHRFLFYNVYLARSLKIEGSLRFKDPIKSAANIFGFQSEVGFQESMGPEPDVSDRATEIGRMLSADGYDVAALAEAWLERDKDRIRSEVQGVGRPPAGDPDQASGPSGDRNLSATVDAGFGEIEIVITNNTASSGLFTLLPGDDARITDWEFREFEAKGYALRDSTPYSSKGVLQTEVDLAPNGPGRQRVDLFSTHLIAGNTKVGNIFGDIFSTVNPVLSTAEKHSPADNLKEKFRNALEQAVEKALGIDAGTKQSEELYRLSEVNELAHFVEEKQEANPENVSVVVGDFNIDASSDGYSDLQQKLGDLGLHDTWPHRGGEIGGTTKIPQVCAFDGSGNAPHYCLDDIGETENYEHYENYENYEEYREGVDSDAQRIDYVFVEAPTDDHTLTLDFSRIRRRPFPREDPGGEMEYLSDHIGLETEFVAHPL